MRLKKGSLHDIAGDKMLVMSDEGIDLTRVTMMNESAEMLWNSLQDREFLQKDAEDLLCEKYGIDRDQARPDAGAWIDAMLKAGLIEA